MGWKALESFSPGLQPGAIPSQLPARVRNSQWSTKKPGVICVTPGFLELAEAYGPMSREQAQREFLAKQAGAIRIRTAVGQCAGALGLRGESNWRCSQLTHWGLLALGHQPFVAHVRQTTLSQTSF